MPTPASLPSLHIRPRRGWLNDPNGMVRHRDRWHVFYQHNPLRAQHAAISWGHASSGDLVSWAEHPVAFGPQPGGPDRGGCWSGHFLPWLDRPAVAYTGITDGPEGSTVCLRYALDEALDVWSDPVVVATEPAGVGLTAMRDPCPLEWGGRRFALLGAGLTDGTPVVLAFSCDDPLAWRYEGVWFSGRDDVAARVAPADIWECPQVVRFGDADVLVLSLWAQGRLEDVAYLVGALEAGPAGGLPRFVPQGGGKLDDGPDFYAPQVIDDGAGDPLLLGWVLQENAPDDAPADAVAGCLTFPRRLALQDGRLRVAPDPALEALVVPVGGTRLPDDGTAAHPLPSRARVGVRGTGHGTPRVDLRADGVPVPVELDVAGGDIWLDGEVAEVFRPGAVAATVRRPGASSWSIATDAGTCVVTVAELALPAPSRQASPRAG